MQNQKTPPKKTAGSLAAEESAEITPMAQAIAEKLVGWDAVRSCAPYLLADMARYTRLGDQVEAAFGGRLFDKGKPPHHPDNVARFYDYFDMLKAVTSMKQRLIREWMRIHGIDLRNPAQIVQSNQMMAQENPCQAVNNDEITAREKELIKIVRILQKDAKTSDMPSRESFREVSRSASQQEPQSRSAINSLKIPRVEFRNPMGLRRKTVGSETSSPLHGKVSGKRKVTIFPDLREANL